MIFLDIHAHTEARNDESVLRVQNLNPGEAIRPDTCVSMGLHPWYVDENYGEQLTLLRESLSRQEVVALGECGLDKACRTPYELQRVAFAEQIALSESHELPLMLHVVRAWDDLLAMRKEAKPAQPWIVHGFRGGKELAEQLIRARLFLSFGCRFEPDALRLAYRLGAALIETDESVIDIRVHYYEVAQIIGCPLQELQRHAVALGIGLFPRLSLRRHFASVG